MPIDLDKYKPFLDSPKNKELLKRANNILIKHLLHVSGIGLDSYIDKIQGVENDKAVSLRRALGKVITQPEINKITTVQNKIFSARGGGRFYDFSNDRDKEYFRNEILKSVKKGYSLNDYMQKIWREQVNIDPMGLIMAEIGEEGLYLTYKCSDSIHDICFDSAQHINYIIFKPFEEENPKDRKNPFRYFRIYDNEGDFLVRYDSNKIILIEDQSYINPFGKVPACFISDRLDKKSSGFTSHIEESLIYADDILLDYTIYRIYKTKIGIPYHWEYESECAACEGSGQIFNEQAKINEKCYICGGKGYINNNRDIADIKILPIPEDGDANLTPPMGFVQGDLQTWKQFEETMDRNLIKMYAAIWGESSTIEGDRRNITASELSVREFSKENKLDEFSINEENVEKFITDLFGVFYFHGTYQGCIVNNGRNYDIKTSDQLMSEYLEALEKGLSTTDLDEKLKSYYHSLYKRNPKKLNEFEIKLKVKPFYHWQPEKLQSANIDKVDYKKNIYFDQFCVYYEQNIEEMGLSTYEKVNQAFDKWIKEKSLKENIQEEELIKTTNYE